MQGEIEQSPRNSQIQQSFIIKNYKNIGLLILLCLFILFVVIVFYFFISLMSTDNETSSFFQYKIVEYDVSDSSIYIQADCIDCQSYYEIKSNYIATSLNITISFLSQTHLNIQIKGLTFPYQYEVPHKLPFPDYKNPFSNSSTSFKEYQVTAVYNPMRLIIIRNQTNEVIFDTADFELIYSRFYIEITTKLPTKFIYGLGERNGLFALENDTYTIWNRMPRYNATNDTASFNYSSNTFGSQPIYMVKENHSYFHTVFLRNFNAMDIDFNNSESDPSLQFRITGGTFDMIFCFGNEEPENSVKLFNDYLGGYMIPPIWSFGLTHVISNYSSVTDLSNLIATYSDESISLDVIWMDYEYMDDGNSFTIDSTNFPETSVNAILETTRLIANIGPCIKINSESTAYTTGIADSVFLYDINETLIYGKNRKIGSCHYPDFFNPNTSNYWIDMFTTLNSVFNFSGIWLDDNEIYDIADDTTYPSNITTYQEYYNYSEIPYYTKSFPLDADTISLNALHYENIKEYDVHSLYGIMQVYETYNYLNETAASPFIYLMTGANSAGFSKFSGHFQDEIPFAWISLKYYLSNMLSYNMFGAPFSGGFICNGLDSTSSSDYDLDLCSRWIQLSTFSPLFLIKTQANDDNIFLGDDLLDVFEATLKLRNSFVPYIYTIIMNSTRNCSIIRPLFYSFINDTNLFNYSNITNNQFTVGDAILVTPILQPNVTRAYVYFPSANWYNFTYCNQLIQKNETGRFILINSTLTGSVPIFLRGGHIVSRASITGTLNLSNSNLILDVAFEKNSSGYYVSQGQILGLADVYNDTAFYENCFVSNCMITAKAEATITVGTSQTHYEILLSFSGDTTATYSIYLTKATFYGLDTSKCVSFSLGTSYQLKVPYSFTMNIYV